MLYPQAQTEKREYIVFYFLGFKYFHYNPFKTLGCCMS